MRIPAGPPLWFCLPYLTVVVWLSLSVAALMGSWFVVAIFAILALITLPLLAVMFLIAQQLRVAAVVLAVMPAILFARIVGPYPYLTIGQTEVLLFYLFKVVGYVVAVWSACMAIYLVHHLPQGWRTPVWGKLPAPRGDAAEQLHLAPRI